jgi:hypothetical protein
MYVERNETDVCDRFKVNVRGRGFVHRAVGDTVPAGRTLVLNETSWKEEQ